MVELRHPGRDDGIGVIDIRIRPYRIGDEAALFEAATESIASMFPWMPWCHPGYSMDEARSWVQRQAILFADRVEFDFVFEGPDGRFLGAGGVNQLHSVNRFANLGYWVRTSARGRGVATRAVAMIRDWAFANTDLQRLELVIATGNDASLRVAGKAGAAREGVLRDRLLLGDTFHDAVMWSFVRPAAAPAPTTSK